jgi:hypothetical protein
MREWLCKIRTVNFQIYKNQSKDQAHIGNRTDGRHRYLTEQASALPQAFDGPADFHIALRAMMGGALLHLVPNHYGGIIENMRSDDCIDSSKFTGQRIRANICANSFEVSSSRHLLYKKNMHH